MVKSARALAFLIVLLSGKSEAERMQTGFGQVSVQGGWRWTANETFVKNAAAEGFEARNLWNGGPVGAASFGYSLNEWLEVSVDFITGAEQFSVPERKPFSSVTYGALVGARAYWFWAEGALRPSLGVLAGPTLVLVSGAHLSKPSEVMETAYVATAGLHWWLWSQSGLTLEYRFLWARGQVPNVGGINGGGNWLSLGVCWLFPPES